LRILNFFNNMREKHADDGNNNDKKTLLLGALAIFLLPTFSCSCPSTPSVSSLSPSSATAGGAGFTLTVNGGNFNSNSVIVWNGTAQTTSFVNGHQLTTSIPGTEIATPDTAVVFVYNPANANQTVSTGTIEASDNTGCGAAGSNQAAFTVSP
jgi:hypothetical protein